MVRSPKYSVSSEDLDCTSKGDCIVAGWTRQSDGKEKVRRGPGPLANQAADSNTLIPFLTERATETGNWNADVLSISPPSPSPTPATPSATVSATAALKTATCYQAASWWVPYAKTQDSSASGRLILAVTWSLLLPSAFKMTPFLGWRAHFHRQY